MKSPLFIFPLSYILIDTFLVIFIKATSVNGHTAYNTITISAITEVIKLCIAINIAHSEGSLHTVLDILRDPGLLIRFAIPNLMYAFNNNLFHYSVGALPPAVFVVTINAFRTIITALLQPLVSGKYLTFRQGLACFLLLLSFVFASLTEVFKALLNSKFQGSVFGLLVYLGGTYSLISVGASLAQEKLLKDSKSLMVANIINYSIGIFFQVFAMGYSKFNNPEEDLFRGLEIFWIKAIPFLMAMVGLSISYVLRYYDNIVKLICSSVSVLLVNSIASWLIGEQFFNLFFLVGWLLTIPATYFYYINPDPTATKEPPIEKNSEKVPSSNKDRSQDDEEAAQAEPLIKPEDHKHKTTTHHTTTNQRIFFGLSAIILVYSLTTSTYRLESNKLSLGSEEQCKLYEVPITDPKSNIRVVPQFSTPSSAQYTAIDDLSGDVYVLCHGHLHFLAPDTSAARAIPNSQEWRRVEPSKLRSFNKTAVFLPTSPIDGSYKLLPWSVAEEMGGAKVPYYWLWCDSHLDSNLVVRPPVKAFKSPRANLLDVEKQEVADYIKALSVPVPNQPSKPIFDTVLVLYLDAVSRLKFHQFYKNTLKVFQELNEHNPESSHIAIELEKLHSIGINSERNYPQFFSGVGSFDVGKFFHKQRGSSQKADITSANAREPWLFDLAESQGYETIGTTSCCYLGCDSNCHEKFQLASSYEVGGVYQQYMSETGNRLPVSYNFPSAAYCEAASRPNVLEKSCSSCGTSPIHQVKRSRPSREMWGGNKLMMGYLLEWWKVALAQKNTPKRFGSVILEETHMIEVFEEIDSTFARFFRAILLGDGVKRYNTGNAALIVMSDHGMHYSSEYRSQTGKVANKQPFGFVILPKNYLLSHQDYYSNFKRNAKGLVSGYDLRATVQYWLTGRDWGFHTLKGQIQDPVVQKVFGSQHGYNVLTSAIPFNRTCEAAGIPREFCGCNLLPCERSALGILTDRRKEVVDFINGRISSNAPEAISVCKPLGYDELLLFYKEDECLRSEETILINGFVSRSLFMISAEFVKGHHGKWKLENVITVSSYSHQWGHCARKLSQETLLRIPQRDQQYCYCDEEVSWESTFTRKVMSYGSF